MKKLAAVALVIFIFKSVSSFAWGARGHKIVAQIAKGFLDKGVQDSVQFYLDHTSFEDAAIWMDEVKSDSAYDKLKPLHYINIEKDKTYVKYDDNIISELEIVIADLKNRKGKNKESIKTSLMILFHLIGDLSQPLHVGYGEDKGGNKTQVQFEGKGTNIHHVWDSEIIESRNVTLVDCMKIAKSYTSKERKDIQKIDIISWMNDSRSYLSEVYSFESNALDPTYIEVSSKIIKVELAKGGLHLASALNDLFHL